MRNTLSPGIGDTGGTVYKASNRKLPFSANQFERPDRTGMAVGFSLEVGSGAEVFSALPSFSESETESW